MQKTRSPKIPENTFSMAEPTKRELLKAAIGVLLTVLFLMWLLWDRI